MANQCEMTSETLVETKEIGPLAVEVFGSRTLCLEAEGDANLAPYTATLRIRNTSPTPVIINYTTDPLRSFRSMAVWPTDRPDAAIQFNDCVGDQSLPTSMEKTVAPRATLLVSSWTRHHNYIWDRDAPKENNPLSGLVARDYTVRFELAMSYDRGSGAIPVAEMFDVHFRAVPVVLEKE